MTRDEVERMRRAYEKQRAADDALFTGLRCPHGDLLTCGRPECIERRAGAILADRMRTNQP